jgi:hypothetical protein
MALTQAEATRIVVAAVRGAAAGEKAQSAAIAEYINGHCHHKHLKLDRLSKAELGALCEGWIQAYAANNLAGRLSRRQASNRKIRVVENGGVLTPSRHALRGEAEMGTSRP